MQSQVNEIDPVTVEVEVEVPWDRVQEGLNAGYGKLQKTARVRGFRKGKVPRSVLRQLYGSQVRNEVVASLVEEGLLAAVQTHEIPLVASPEVSSVPSIKKGEPLAFTAKLEVRPKVEKVEVDGLELKRPSTEIADEAVESEILQLRERNAEIETPDEPRPAREGDLLTIDYTVELDGEVNEEMGAKARSVELGAGRLLPEFEEGLVGKKPGDEFDIEVSFDEEMASPELKGKTALFHVSVTEQREKILPELDDEFAKDLGEYETLAELRDKTRERLQEAAETRAKSSLREQAIAQLVEKNPIPVPPSLIDQQEKAMRQELAFLMQMAPGMDFGDGDFRERAENKVRAGLLMGELATQRELTVEPEEVEAKLQEIASETGKHIAKIRVEYAGEKRDQLSNRLLEDKLLDFLLGQAKVTDAPADDASEEG